MNSHLIESVFEPASFKRGGLGVSNFFTANLQVVIASLISSTLISRVTIDFEKIAFTLPNLLIITPVGTEIKRS